MSLPKRVPALLRALLNLEDAPLACASPFVAPDRLRETLLANARSAMPNAVVVSPMHVARGRVDIALLHEDVAVGILLEPSEPIGGGVRTGGGSEAFDHAVALSAYPKDHLLEGKPPNVWGFRAFTDVDDAVRFELVRPAETGPTDSRERRLAMLAKARRTRARAIDGEAVAQSLLPYLEERHAALAIAREFPCGGSVADVAVITGDELHVYEIKGDGDSAARLATQAPNYDRVASTCTLVTTCRHRTFRARVPSHWGIVEAAWVRGAVQFMQLRAPALNPRRTIDALVDLLDAGDVRKLLRTHATQPNRAMTLPQLRQTLLNVVDEASLATIALAVLARRARFF